MSSECVPCATTRPPSTTITVLASRTVDSRWATWQGAQQPVLVAHAPTTVQVQRPQRTIRVVRPSIRWSNAS